MGYNNLFLGAKRYDYSFFALSFLIVLAGIFNLYSATHTSSSDKMANLYLYQMAWYSFSLVIGVAISFVHPKNFFHYALFSYVTCLLLLILVLVIGDEGLGARRWLVIGPFRAQPSEIAKICVILVLGRHFAKKKLEGTIGLVDLVKPSFLTLLPTTLVIIQPDLGTGILIVLIFFSIIFYKRIRWKTVVLLSFLGILS